MGHLRRYLSRYGRPQPSRTALRRWFRLQKTYVENGRTYRYRDPKTGETKTLEIRKRRQDLFVIPAIAGLFEGTSTGQVKPRRKE